MVINKKVNINRLMVYTNSKDKEGSGHENKLEEECEDFDNEVLIKQLNSHTSCDYGELEHLTYYTTVKKMNILM